MNGANQTVAEGILPSDASVAFEKSIKDSEELLAHFDAMPKPPPANAEVLKRACLVMAITAWETYVEDRVREGVTARLDGFSGSQFARLIAVHLEEELKRFNNPTAEKTKKLFRDHLEVDVTELWEWQHVDSARAKATLDKLIAKRGEAVHRSRRVLTGVPAQPHLVRREDLVRAIKFLKSLVKATDEAVARRSLSAQPTSG